MPTLEDAIALAARAHHGQVDKAGQPYILHPLRVMLALDTDVERIVGVLHDVIEDSGKGDPSRQITLNDLRTLGYPDEALVALDLVTRRESESYDEFVERLLPNPIARRVKLADLADNLDLTRLPSVAEPDVERLNRYLRARQKLLAAR